MLKNLVEEELLEGIDLEKKECKRCHKYPPILDQIRP